MFRLCIDPGLLSPGAAIFGDTTLVATKRFAPEVSNVAGKGVRCMDIARQITGWCLATLPKIPIGGLEIVFEWPQQYNAMAGKTKGDPNNLTPLAGIGMAVAGLLNLDPITPLPAQWVGQLPKTCPLCKANKTSCKVCTGSAWLTPRGRVIRDLLRAGELAITPDQNDVIDAVGIGLWRTGRLNLRAQFSGLAIA